jgi:alanyl-tRNA synthetase
LDRGLSLFDEVAASVVTTKSTVFPGEAAFKLYDTYGFPLDLTVVMAKEKGLEVDEKRFAVLMDEQRKRARDARKAATADADVDLVSDLVASGIKTKFTGYTGLSGTAPVLKLLGKDAAGVSLVVETLSEGQEGAILLVETPFYPEKGGQVGDLGTLTGPEGEFEVTDTRQPTEGIVLHVGRVTRGKIASGATVSATVDSERRAATARHHTATHLLQFALKEIVGTSIKQAGSMVSPERLRFDFNYFQALTPAELAAVERRVNELILGNASVTVSEMALKDVPGSGIVAIFDEKYGDTVRVVNVGGYSRELCGGTHVSATGTIGLFRLVSESSIASGVRRIEAVTGLAAYDVMCADRSMLEGLAKRFSVSPAEVSGRVEALADQVKTLDKQIKENENAAAMQKLDGVLAAATEVKGMKLMAVAVGEVSADALKNLADAALAQAGSAVVVLGASSEGKAQFIVVVSPDLVKKGVHAGKIIKEVAKIAGGGGGGQPAMARAGGKDVSKIAEAVAKARELL